MHGAALEDLPPDLDPADSAWLEALLRHDDPIEVSSAGRDSPTLLLPTVLSSSQPLALSPPHCAHTVAAAAVAAAAAAPAVAQQPISLPPNTRQPPARLTSSLCWQRVEKAAAAGSAGGGGGGGGGSGERVFTVGSGFSANIVESPSPIPTPERQMPRAPLELAPAHMLPTSPLAGAAPRAAAAPLRMQPGAQPGHAHAILHRPWAQGPAAVPAPKRAQQQPRQLAGSEARGPSPSLSPAPGSPAGPSEEAQRQALMTRYWQLLLLRQRQLKAQAAAQQGRGSSAQSDHSVASAPPFPGSTLQLPQPQHRGVSQRAPAQRYFPTTSGAPAVQCQQHPHAAPKPALPPALPGCLRKRSWASAGAQEPASLPTSPLAHVVPSPQRAGCAAQSPPPFYSVPDAGAASLARQAGQGGEREAQQAKRFKVDSKCPSGACQCGDRCREQTTVLLRQNVELRAEVDRLQRTLRLWAVQGSLTAEQAMAFLATSNKPASRSTP